LERRSLVLSHRLIETTACPADLYVGPRFNQPSAWAMKSAGLGIVSNRLIGGYGARPEVGWAPLEMEEAEERPPPTKKKGRISPALFFSPALRRLGWSEGGGPLVA
jgi:hypothetical protein